MIQFTKMHGLGNDFMVIDAMRQTVSLSSETIRKLADRHFGIGFDQLLLVEKARQKDHDFRYRIFNADGSEVAQCGNGARCFARFVHEKKLTNKTEITVETDSGTLILNLTENGLVCVNMGIPQHNPSKIPLLTKAESSVYTIDLDGQKVDFSAVSMGNPHAVIEVESVDNAPVERLGPLLESHPFFPERANIGFLEIIDRQHIRLRVYERGASETLACGSGACAAAVIAMEKDLVSSPVSVALPGGKLIIEWQGRGKPVLMTGPAVTVFEGEIEL